MKPLKLTLCNFCSYTGENNVIDFTKFGSKGIYVITGPKGAGKSTIFDGITFALYGKKSNSLGKDNVRSKYAPEQGETFVEFEFLYGDRRYIIKRSYAISRTRNNNIKKNEAVEITEFKVGEEAKSYPGNTSDLNKIIENDIIKLTFDQFTQIVMLVQGDFKKLLKANNDEKRAIFQKIFNTGRYAGFEREFELKAAQLEASHKEERLKFVEKLKQISCSEEFSGAEKLAEYRAVEFSDRFEETIELLGELIAYEQEQLKLYEEQRDAKLRAVQAFAERSAKAVRQQELKEALAKLQQQLAAEEKPLQLAKDRLEAIKAGYETELEQLTRAMTELEGQRQRLTKLEAAVAAKKAGETAVAGFVAANDSLKKEIARADTFLEKNQEELAALEQAIVAEDVLEQIGKGLKLQNDKIAEEVGAMKALQLEQSKQQQQQEALAEKLAGKQKAVEAQEQLVKEAQTADKEVISLENTYKDYAAALKTAQELLGQGKDYTVAVKGTKEACEAYAKAFKALTEQETRVRYLEQIYKDSLAGLWALKLAEGEPCPVCGSREHPQKAQLRDGKISEAEVEAAQEVLKELLEEANKAKGIAEAKQAQETNNLQKLTAGGKQHYGLEAYEDIVAKAQEQAKYYMEQCAFIVVEGKKARGLANQLKEREASLQTLQREKEKLASAQQELAGELAGMAGKLQMAMANLEKGLGALEIQELELSAAMSREQLLVAAEKALAIYKKLLGEYQEKVALNKRKLKEKDALLQSSEALQKSIKLAEEKIVSNNLEAGKQQGAIEKLQEQIAELELQLKGKALAEIQQQEYVAAEAKERLIQGKAEAEKCYTELNDKHKQQEQRQELLTKELEELTSTGEETETAEALQELKAGAEKEAEAYKAQWLRLHSQLEINTKVYADCQEKINLLASASHKVNMWNKLSRLVNGTLTGKPHKSLEIFVQQAYLEKILARAHDKLMLMTDGQYEFRRRPEEARSSTVAGLGIDVVDHTNESVRSVDTLSGGESFAAALALSLAVADEIQSSSGGVRLDSMFIDEGFGSLDSDSLSLAMRVLNDLSDNNYLIGIISHVKELEENVEKKLEVKKSEDMERVSTFTYVV